MEKLSVSLEDYIEEIYNQVLKSGSAKVTEISKAMNVRKASVTGALNSLAEKNLINYAPYAPITLTAEGEKIAGQIRKKHEAIAEFFVTVLDTPEDEALETACKMEHIVSDRMFENIVKLTELAKKNPHLRIV
ncbi:MAG: metal-dependent transcriptional regulator [Heliobacteriaceae bacterium]|jgi:DtxR family Mn-dependent transcriptional regulator|nr:metal-dependent transcriptional regulator [Heliobacteriaceae bacterium]